MEPSSTQLTYCIPFSMHLFILYLDLFSVSPCLSLSLPVSLYLSLSLSLSAVRAGMYIAGVFKNMGETHFEDEIFLTAVGTYAALSNTLGRLTIGAVADRYGPLKTLSVTNFILCAVLATYAYTPYMGEVSAVRLLH